jgi:hypothetical protein
MVLPPFLLFSGAGRQKGRRGWKKLVVSLPALGPSVFYLSVVSAQTKNLTAGIEPPKNSIPIVIPAKGPIERYNHEPKVNARLKAKIIKRSVKASVCFFTVIPPFTQGTQKGAA